MFGVESWGSLFSSAVGVLYLGAVITTIVVVILDNRNPVKTLSWVLVLSFLPMVGLVLYYFFGRDTRKEKLIGKKGFARLTRRPMAEYQQQQALVVQEDQHAVMQYFRNVNDSLPFDGNDVAFYTSGEAMIEALLEAIAGAKHHIHIQFYIFEADEVGKKVCEALMKKAREGVEVERKVREINVPALELITQTAPNRYLVRIVCSKGTYVRTLCHDIGERIGVPAHMSFLLRTRSGAFDLDGAFTIGELREMKEQDRLGEAVTSIEQSLMHIGEARMELNAKGEKFLTHGAEVVFPGVENLPVDIPLRGYCNGKFLGIAKSNGEAVHICTFLGEDINE